MIFLFRILYRQVSLCRKLRKVFILGSALLLGDIAHHQSEPVVRSAPRQPTRSSGREQPIIRHFDRLGDPLPQGGASCYGTCRLRHSREVRRLAFSPDGKLIASVGDDYTLRIWDTHSGKPVQSIFLVDQNAYLYFSPNGKSLASTFGDSKIIVWDLATGKARFTIKGQKFSRSTITFSPDGKYLLTDGPDGGFSFWDAHTGVFYRRSSQLLQDVSAVRFISKHDALVVRRNSDSLDFFRLSTDKGSCTISRDPDKGRLRVGKGYWPFVSISPDGQWIAAYSIDRSASVWNVRTGTERCRLPATSGDDELFSMDISRNGKHLAINALRGIRLWDLSSRQLLLSVPHITKSDVRFSPDGRILAAGSGRRVRLFDVATAKELPSPPGHAEAVQFVNFSPSGEYLASASDRSIRIWNVQSSQQHQVLPLEEFYRASEIWAQFSKDGHKLIARDSRNTVSFWDVQSGKRLRRMAFPTEIAAFVLSPDGTHFLVDPDRTSESHNLQLCGIADGKVVHTFPTTMNVGLMEFLPDSKEMVVYEATRSLEGFGVLLVWDVATGKQRRRIPDLLEKWQEVHSLAISPNSRYLSTGSGRARVILGNYPTDLPESNPVQIWDIASGKPLLRLERHHAAVVSLAWSPDGRILASGSEEGLICLWEVASGKELTCYETKPNGVHGITFSPQGQILASAMDDTTVLLWDIAPADWRKPAKALAARERTQRWTDLGSEDASTSYRALWDLAAEPADTVSFLKERLQVVPDVQPKRLEQLIADLDSDSFARRETASRELYRLGTIAESALRKALGNSPSAELRRRAELLLKALPGWLLKEPETLRIVRAIWVLQRIGTPEARAILEKLAVGAPAARQTQEAKAAVDYLNRIKK